MEQDKYLPETMDTAWIERLALEEISMDETGVVNFNQHLDPLHYLEQASIAFMDEVRERFEIYINRFNEYRSHGQHGSQIKIFKISNTVNDFMLYRHALKLVIARKACDVVSIGFISNTGGLYAARTSDQAPSINMAHEIKANVGPFNEITWRFNGEVVNVDCLVQHYLTEFIKHSAK